ncbi:MAG TPA: hypothetical protein ENI13_02015 [candidate division CPR3 bacterium]|uniref:Uncharacterized protein n=1 Tax=candidate division CPR3 bacterium TaxID=2268181 RepID=A0A7C1SUW2_UNCC3|nr:hypothetical protein [candidate division CPR3 bacterium]
MQDIFGLDIDKLAKGFGTQKYTFLEECQVRQMKIKRLMRILLKRIQIPQKIKKKNNGRHKRNAGHLWTGHR